jgi:hypothetical protein
MSYQQTRETLGTIIAGRKALADNEVLRDAWAGLLEAITAIPLADRVAFPRYVRLVHGTTAGLTIPQVITEEEVDEVRKALAGFRRGAPLLLLDEDVDVDDYGVRWVGGDTVALELASDRPDRG